VVGLSDETCERKANGTSIDGHRTRRFRDEEVFETRSVLEQAGHRIDIASTRVGECPGTRGGVAVSEPPLDRCRASDYDAVVFVGGGGSMLLWDDPDALRLAREADELGRVTGAICLAPVILSRAGVLESRIATVAGTQPREWEAANATYAGPGVFTDGLVVTAHGPKSSRAFGEQLAALLAARSGALTNATT